MKTITLALTLAFIGMINSHAFAPPPVNTETLNFDDLNGPATEFVPAGYGGIDSWFQFQAQNYLVDPNSTDASTPNFIYNDARGTTSMSNSTPFNLISAYVGSDYDHTDYTLTVTAYDSASMQIGQVAVPVSGSTPGSLVNFNLYGASSITFSGGGTAFALDNMTLSGESVPEPSTYALIGLSLAAMAFAARTRKIAQI